jgi:hypothetical protein
MSRRSQAALLAALLIAWGGVSASAETLRCQSVNGNINCAGSGAASCQTIDGKTVCVSSGGGIVQSFGNHTPSTDPDDPTGFDDEDFGKSNPGPPGKGRHGRADHTIVLDRTGKSLHLRTEPLSIDGD